MIRAVLPGDSLFAPSAAGPDPYGAIHTARWELYGRGAGPPRFWRTPKADGVLSLSGDTLVLSGRFSDSEELAAFCAICGAKTLRGPASALAETAARLNWPIQSRQILSAVDVLRPTPIPPGICEPSPREVYPLLQGVFDLPEADFAPWYCEVSHKLRHQQGTLLGVREEGQIIATDLSSKQTSGSDWVGSDSSGFSQARICGGAGVSAGGPRAGKR